MFRALKQSFSTQLKLLNSLKRLAKTKIPKKAMDTLLEFCFLPLPLFVARISADNKDDTSPSNNLALFTHSANAGANLHTTARGGLPTTPLTRSG